MLSEGNGELFASSTGLFTLGMTSVQTLCLCVTAWLFQWARAVPSSTIPRSTRHRTLILQADFNLKTAVSKKWESSDWSFQFLLKASQFGKMKTARSTALWIIWHMAKSLATRLTFGEHTKAKQLGRWFSTLTMLSLKEPSKACSWINSHSPWVSTYNYDRDMRIVSCISGRGK